jgi:signal recognition particle subunit SRP54
MLSRDFTLDDFARNLQLVEQFGPQAWFGRLPGGAIGPEELAALHRIRAMIAAMSADERQRPESIDEDAERRIAMLSGTKPRQVQEFLRQFDQVRETMKRMGR